MNWDSRVRLGYCCAIIALFAFMIFCRPGCFNVCREVKIDTETMRFADDGSNPIVTNGSPTFVSRSGTKVFKRIQPPLSRNQQRYEFDRGLEKIKSESQYPYYTPESKSALAFGAKSRLTLKVVDASGNPVEDANVAVIPEFRTVYRKSHEFMTNKDGLVSFSSSKASIFVIDIRKDGFYTTRHELSMFVPGYECVKDGKWLPWNPTLEMVLKEIREPISLKFMCADDTVNAREWVGIDLEHGALMPPYGDGTIENAKVFMDGNNAYAKATMCFNDGGGAIRLRRDIFSDFRFIYDCPQSGYTNTWETIKYYHSQDGVKVDTTLTDGEYMVFRYPIAGGDGNTTFRYGLSTKGILGAMRDGNIESSVWFPYYLQYEPGNRHIETTSVYH